MKVNSNYFCSVCNEQLEIEKGDLLFTYKINCLNGHKSNNIFIDELLLKKDLMKTFINAKNIVEK